MKIFSPHRRKLEARRRFGSREFQNKIKRAQGYKRVLHPQTAGKIRRFLDRIYLGSTAAQTLLLIVFLGAAYLLFAAGFFLVDKIEVTGNSQVSVEQVEQAIDKLGRGRLFLMRKNHFFLLTRKRAEQMLTAEIPTVKSVVSYKRTWPNAVSIEIQERSPGFVLRSRGGSYLVDDEGVVVRDVSQPDGLPLVINQVDEQLAVAETLNNTRMVAFVLSAHKQWPIRISTPVAEIRMPGKASTQLQYLTQEGWGVFFDITRSAESQLASLATILNRQIPARERVNLAYIDLRFSKWAYYCYRNTPCEARPQDEAGPAAEPGQEQVETPETASE